jgi:precorrin-3B C17-methyltransferase
MIERINKACKYYPCHDIDKLEDCVFCYCPFYPCNDLTRGGQTLDNGIWDCSDCTWIHNKERVDKIYKFLNSKQKDL